MAQMKKSEKDMMIKTNAIGTLSIPENAVQVGDFAYAIPSTVDGEERWAVITVVAKNNQATKTSQAFDPHEVREEWLEEKALKEKAAAEKTAKKAEKVKKAKDKEYTM